MLTDENIARLTKHSKDCVEGKLLLDVVSQIEETQLRIQHLVSEVSRLERELSNKGI